MAYMPMPISKFEKLLICESVGVNTQSFSGASPVRSGSRREANVGDYVSYVLNCEYETCLLQSSCSALLGGDEDSIDTLQDAILNRVLTHLRGSDDSILDREIEVLCVGISLLNLFIQNNWTGPATSCQPTDFLSINLSNKVQDCKEFCLEALNSNGQTTYPLVDYPEFIMLARLFLVQCCPLLTHCQTAEFWALRCLWVQQQILDERSPEIHAQIMSLRKSILEKNCIMSDEGSNELCIRFHVECSPICHYYYQYTDSKEHLEAAQKAAGMEVSFTGALGKRTKFQQNNFAQLLLKIEKEDRRDEATFGVSEEEQMYVKKHLPKDLQLDDDTLLGQVKFLEETDSESPSLRPLEQAIILGLWAEHQRSSAKFELLKEELSAYIENVLQQPQSWGAQMRALMARSLLEKDKGRKVERAMMQMEVLVNQLKNQTCPVPIRLNHFYSFNLPPKWILEGEYANLLMSLGSISAALQVFLRLHLWEDAIKCYQKMDKLDKAERLVRDQLALKETPLMWCLLGEVTRKPEHYLTAWELSNHKSARAQRSLGKLYLDEEKYEECIQCFEKSLERNSLQYDTWFLLGFAALKIEQYTVAIKAYRKCVTIEVDNFEAWNNLANAHIKLKQKSKAHLTLQEAIKCNYENGKIWENFLFVAIDVGDFKGSIRSYNRLLDLKGKYTDEDVLRILVRAVVEDLPDKEGNSASSNKKRLLELFGRLTSVVIGNAQVWRLYSKLLGDGKSSDPVDNDKALQCLQKSHRSRTQSNESFRDVESCKEIIEESLELAQAYQLCSKAKSNQVEAVQMLSSAKLMVKSVMSKVNLHHDVLGNESSSERLSGLEQELQNIMSAITKRKEQG